MRGRTKAFTAKHVKGEDGNLLRDPTLNRERWVAQVGQYLLTVPLLNTIIDYYFPNLLQCK